MCRARAFNHKLTYFIRESPLSYLENKIKHIHPKLKDYRSTHEYNTIQSSVRSSKKHIKELIEYSNNPNFVNYNKSGSLSGLFLEVYSRGSFNYIMEQRHKGVVLDDDAYQLLRTSCGLINGVGDNMTLFRYSPFDTKSPYVTTSVQSFSTYPENHWRTSMMELNNCFKTVIMVDHHIQNRSACVDTVSVSGLNEYEVMIDEGLHFKLVRQYVEDHGSKKIPVKEFEIFMVDGVVDHTVCEGCSMIIPRPRDLELYAMYRNSLVLYLSRNSPNMKFTHFTE
jgi:Txe/YoeB family toxin of Txe-Axe toxin-antitoxin module